MVSITPRSAHFGFSSVHPGFQVGLLNEPRDCMKMIETYLKRSELSASNTYSTSTLFWITERKKIDSWVVTIEIICMYV